MPVRPRRGFTLIELLVSLILLGLVGLAAGRLLIGQRRAASALLAGDLARRTTDQASAWIASELSEAGRGDSATDLLGLGPDWLTYRGWRLAGLACLVTESEVRIARTRVSGWRMPQPGRDSLFLYLGQDSIPGSGAWSVLPLLGVGAANCGGAPALSLTTRIDARLLEGLPPLVPVRTFEVMQLRLYRSLGEWWLGARSVSGGEGVQPLTGPLEERGLELKYLDQSGSEVSLPGLVSRLQIMIAPAGVRDSAWFLIQPRNLQ